MDYQLLTTDEHHEDLASHRKGCERDHALNVANVQRYETMLKGKLTDAFRARMEKLLETEREREQENAAILKSMDAHFPDKSTLAAAMKRLQVKNAKP